MTEKFDVAARLAEGRPAVDDIQNYVWACHLLGYQNPDLTMHAAQVRDWYGSEDGLDLLAMDNDCGALDAAVSAVQDALARQDDAVSEVSAAWQGRGADASREFLRRHLEASTAAAAAVRTAADALAALRHNLWRTVDRKVATTIAVGGRAQADWLAAAQTVATGAGDRAAASELVDQQVKPFVDNDIRMGWITAMRSATSAVADLYDTATAELTAEGDAVFDVPGELGPSWSPPAPRDDDVATTPASAAIPAMPVASAPPVWSAPTAAPPMPAAIDPVPSSPAPVASPPVDPAATAPAMAAPPSIPSLGGMGSGLPDIGSGFSGLGQQLADAVGSLLGSRDDALADPPKLDDPQLDDPKADQPDPAADKPDEEALDDTDAEDAVGEEAADEPAVDDANSCETAQTPTPLGPATPSVEPAPTPIPPPPEAAIAPPEPAPDPAAGETPCEIAADELPQVGQ